MKDYKALYEKQKELIEIQKQYIDWINRHEPNTPVSMRGKQMLLESIKIESELASLQGEQDNHSQTWMCPRCYKIHSYLKTSCDCDPNTITSTTYPQEQESDEDITDLEDHEIHNDINEDRRNGTIE